jgi:WD40 repeat protein
VQEGHGDGVRAAAFSPDGRHVVSGSHDGGLRMWDVVSRTSRTLGRHGGWVMAVGFSPDGLHIVSGSVDGTLRLWDVASGTSRTLGSHGDRRGPWDSVRAAAFSPDGRHVVSGSDDRTLRLWEAASGQEIVRFYGDVEFHAIHLAPDGKSLAAGDSGGRVHLVDILVDNSDKATWLASQRG